MANDIFPSCVVHLHMPSLNMHFVRFALVNYILSVFMLLHQHVDLSNEFLIHEIFSQNSSKLGCHLCSY